MSNYETIQFHTDHQVAWITLNRPPLNVMNIQMMEELVQALIEVQGDRNLKALVIQAEGKAFCAGVAVEDHLGDKAEPMIHVFHKIFHLLTKVSCPTIAVVKGAAIGGGCELATFCDYVIATDRAKFGQPEINLGLFPPVSVVAFPWMTGMKRTMELLLTGETIDSKTACEWGLITRVVAEEDVKNHLEQLLQNLRNKSAVALQLTKKAVQESMAVSFAAALGKVEQIYLNELIQTKDAQEGLHSFLEKREPKWKNE